MTSRGKLAQLGGLIRAKRIEQNLGLREAAKVSGVSPSTLSRLERKVSFSLPDLDTLNRLSVWLKVPIEEILGQKDLIPDQLPPDLRTIDKIEIHLRADKDLKPETAEALASTFRILYKNLYEAQENKKH